MALPKLEVPKYMMTVPSTGDEIEFRPFLVREEKILLLAMEEQTETATHNAVLDLVHSCTFGSLGKKNDPMFDIEYAFIKIRSKSVSETIDVKQEVIKSSDHFFNNSENRVIEKVKKYCESP